MGNMQTVNIDEFMPKKMVAMELYRNHNIMVMLSTFGIIGSIFLTMPALAGYTKITYIVQVIYLIAFGIPILQGLGKMNYYKTQYNLDVKPIFSLKKK